MTNERNEENREDVNIPRGDGLALIRAVADFSERVRTGEVILLNGNQARQNLWRPGNLRSIIERPSQDTSRD